MYGSNYPPPGFGGGSNYPPSNSGPPPPPGGYGGGGGYGSAYNVNSYYAHQGQYQQQPQQQQGGGYTYTSGGGMAQGGAVAGFTAPPAVNQCRQQYQQQAPQGMRPPNMPYSSQTRDMNRMMYEQQQGQLQQMQQMMASMAAQQQGGGRRRRRRREEDDEEEEEQEEDAPSGPSESDMKAAIKRMFCDEMMRRQAVSGTFDITSGTVCPFEKYGAEDPVNVFHGSSLTDKPWDPEMDCEYLRKAMKGAGTDEDAIILVVSSRCNQQRQELKKMFKTMYGRDLIEDLDSELSGDFRESIMACFVKPAVYDAWCVKEAIYGLGTDEETLIEVLMTRTNAQIQELRNCYGDVASPSRKVKDTKLEEDVKDDTSGDFKRLLISASQGNRYEISANNLADAVEEMQANGKGTGILEVNYQRLVDMDKAKKDAQRLYEAGEKKWGTDEETFNIIFSTRDYYTLKAIWDEYVKITQRDILNSVDRETSGDFRRSLKAVVMNIRCRPMFFAERLRDSMKGLGTDDKTLIRVIISRSEIDMLQIKKCFLELTKQTLWNWLEDDCSGDYRKILQAIVGKD